MSVTFIGAGPGPGLITVRGLEALRRADVILYDDLLDSDLLSDPALESAEKIFVGKRSGAHSVPQEETTALLISKANEGKRVARLKGGDSFVFGRGGEEALALQAAGIPFELVPGVSGDLPFSMSSPQICERLRSPIRNTRVPSSLARAS